MLNSPEVISVAASGCPESSPDSWPERRADAIRLGVLVDVTPGHSRPDLRWNFPGQVAITDTLQHALLLFARERGSRCGDPICSVLNAAAAALDELIEAFELFELPTPFREAFVISFVADPPLDRVQPGGRLTLLLEPGEREEPVVTIGIETDFAVDDAQ